MIGGSPASLVLTAGAVLTMVAAIVTFVMLAVQAGTSKQQVTTAAEMRVLSQQLAKNALEAAAGNGDAFALLARAQRDYQTAWDTVRDADIDAELARQLEQTWRGVSRNTEVILRGEDTVVALHDVAEALGEAIPIIQDESEEVVRVMIRLGAGPDQVAFAQRQSWLAERIVRSVARILAGGDGAKQAADAFGTDAERFARVLEGLITGDAGLGVLANTDELVLNPLAEIASLFDEYVTRSLDEILETAPQLTEVRAAADNIFRQTQDLLAAATTLNDAFERSTAGLFPSVPLGLLFALLSAILLGAQLFLRSRVGRRQRERLESENQRNQAAILRLLDELGDLADGDLTVEATVTEDFTGAIADSINYSIDQLRSLVQTINQTAVQVASAAQETQSTAMHLAEASEHQAQEIAGASAAVNEMAVSIDQVSANAAESAAVAERSVGIANKGADVVQSTIHGMDTIREQIQETSKRIKRLGESSQEIGDIVSLINDIADQTNILALNAAIQASMAGEAGRGFAVVADEVQRLAERSAGATKQIETLVKTIQTDTNEAVISMEHTTAEVVKGARLAQDGGVALEEIETVSKSLADLIQNISNAARQQAASAGHISNTMNVIQEITSQTSAGTTATARSIGNLAQMAQEMRQSVAGFRLPEHE
ncbi:methyl-accepting chemotaxis protein [Isoalcanivorax beigongshangi]